MVTWDTVPANIFYHVFMIIARSVLYFLKYKENIAKK